MDPNESGAGAPLIGSSQEEVHRAYQVKSLCEELKFLRRRNEILEAKCSVLDIIGNISGRAGGLMGCSYSEQPKHSLQDWADSVIESFEKSSPGPGPNEPFPS